MGYTKKAHNPNVRDKSTATEVLKDMLRVYRDTEDPETRHCAWKEAEKFAQELRKAGVMNSIEMTIIAIRVTNEIIDARIKEERERRWS